MEMEIAGGNQHSGSKWKSKWKSPSRSVAEIEITGGPKPVPYQQALRPVHASAGSVNLPILGSILSYYGSDRCYEGGI